MPAGIVGLAQTAVAALAGEPVTESRWHAPWSEPVRSRIAPQLAVALIASGLAYVEAAPFAERVTEDRWHQAWSEPVRTRWLPPAEQQPLAFQPGPADPYGWYAPLSEPVRIRAALPTPEQHVFEFEPAPFVSFGWWAPLAEPVRTRLLATAHRQACVPDPLPRVSFSWWNWLSEPVRIRPALPSGEQQVSPFDEEIVWADRWFAWWSEPVVKARPRLVEAAQQWLAFPPPFNAGAVQSEWAGPPPSLVRFQYQAQARPPWPDINIAFAVAWSEPVRVRPALFAGSQQVLAFDPQPFPFLGGGGGWYLPDPTRPPSETGEPRKVKKPGSPREVAPKVEPPTFAEVLDSQQPAKLADVFGANFAEQLGRVGPPALDLYVPPGTAADTVQKVSIPPARIDAIADEVDARDAMEALQALDELDRQEREFLISAVLSVFAKQT